MIRDLRSRSHLFERELRAEVVGSRALLELGARHRHEGVLRGGRLPAASRNVAAVKLGTSFGWIVLDLFNKVRNGLQRY